MNANITADDVLERLHMLSEEITNSVGAPNYGGCGVIAGIVGEHLQALGIQVEVVTPTGMFSEPAAVVALNVNNHDDVDEWDDNGLSRRHMAVRFVLDGSTYTWDSDILRKSASEFGVDRGKTPYYTTKAFGDGMAVEDCVAISAKQKGWNRSFDRDQIPLIQDMADCYLGTLKEATCA